MKQHRTEVIFDRELAIFKRKDSDDAFYWCRIKFPKNPALYHSTKAPDKRDAMQVAQKLYLEAKNRLEKGVSLKAIAVGKAKDIYYETLDVTHTHKLRRLRLDKYFFSKLWHEDVVEQVKWQELVDAINPELKPTYRNLIISDLAHFLNWLYRKEELSKKIELERIKIRNKQDFRRPDWTAEELIQLAKEGKRWIAEEGLSKTSRFVRQVVYYSLRLNTHLGARPSALYNLRWVDVKKTKDGYSFYLEGKGHRHTGVMNRAGDQYLETLKGVQQEYFGERWNEGFFVISNTRGGSLKNSYYSVLNQFLDTVGLKTTIDNGVEKSRTLYSSRHSYATQRLKHNVDIYALSKNMATSLQMIQDFYSHVEPEDIRHELTKNTYQAIKESRSKARLKEIIDGMSEEQVKIVLPVVEAMGK